MARAAGAQPLIPGPLREALNAGSCVVYVGAGFSRVIGMPTWGELLDALYAHASNYTSSKTELRACRDCIDAGDYAVAASYLRRVLPDVELHRQVSLAFRDRRLNEATPPDREVMLSRMQDLINGPWSGIITTNFDTLIERALADSFDRAVRAAFDSQSHLGSLLHRDGNDDMFFAKIHGSLNSGPLVLSAQEYDAAYLGSPKIRNFLVATMMAHNVVFVGASLEDEVLRIRRQLCVDYQGSIPLAFALLPDNKRNRMRAQWMQDAAAVRSLLYPDGQHETMDRFLKECRALNEARRAGELPLTERASTIRRMKSLAQRFEEVGQVNQEIITFLRDHHSGAINKEQLLGLKETLKLPGALAKLSRSELFYRITFLVSVDLIVEMKADDGPWYMVRDLD